jgi:hypothetical protein
MLVPTLLAWLTHCCISIRCAHRWLDFIIHVRHLVRVL